MPTALALWLVGLGVNMTWNPPGEPRRNAVVERFQGVGQCWLEPRTCATAEELQKRADASDVIQRREYPAIGGLTRMEAFPGLAHSGRRYRRRDEKRQWDLDRVLQWLSGHAVRRRVSKDGKISVYDRNLWVGREWSGHQVWVRLDPEDKAWLIIDDKKSLLNRVPADELTAERIWALSVSREREGH